MLYTNPVFNEIKQIAHGIASKYNIDNAPCDPQKIALYEGYNVFYASYCDSIKQELASYILDNNDIFINEDMETKNIIFSIAHELGIGILKLNRNRIYNRKYCENIFSSNQSLDDCKANVFALHLLLPDIILRKVFEWIYTDNALGLGTQWDSYSKALCINEINLKARVNGLI
jgi:Zn-dependent peptidase ImmA (M78 family)